MHLPTVSAEQSLQQCVHIVICFYKMWASKILKLQMVKITISFNLVKLKSSLLQLSQVRHSLLHAEWPRAFWGHSKKVSQGYIRFSWVRMIFRVLSCVVHDKGLLADCSVVALGNPWTWCCSMNTHSLRWSRRGNGSCGTRHFNDLSVETRTDTCGVRR